MKLKSLILLTLLSLSINAQAYPAGALRVGAQIGHLALQQELGEKYGAGTVAGGAFSLGLDGTSAWEVGYLTASLKGLSHHEGYVGFLKYISVFKSQWILPHVDGGVTYLSNSLPVLPEALASSGFGVFVGAGADFEISRRLKPDLTVRYVKGFEQTVQTVSGDRLKSIQDNWLVLFRLFYEFGSDESSTSTN